MAKPSTESLSIATVSVPMRAKPPSDLTKRQAELWTEVQNTKPADWFEADSYPLLKAYVVSIELHEKLTAEINQMDVTDSEITPLVKLQDLQARTMSTLAVKMRLTQQSRYTPGAAATANKKTRAGRKPWEDT